jgi:exodeoxyribonuclease VII small subunit
MAELTGIVNRLRDSEDVDVDELVTDVANAKELIQFCGGKIKKADSAIKGIVSELQSGGETTPEVAVVGHDSENGDGAEIPF